jgi:hypothetical protein
MMVLVTGNLAVFAAIVGTLYLLFRRAWGPGAAFASSAVFIAVFGFSQFAVMGNFNYATPYSHEATHGLLVCLLLVVVLVRWIDRTTAGGSFLAGGLLGLTLVLKPEIVLAGALVTVAAGLVRHRQRGPLSFRVWIAWIAGVFLPSAGFAAYFSRTSSWWEALAYSSRAWLSVATTTRFTGEAIQAEFLGFDRPWAHLIQHVVAALLAVLLIGGLCGFSRLADRVGSPVWRTGCCGLVVLGTAVLGLTGIDWAYTGSCLLGLVLVYLLTSLGPLVRKAGPGESATRGNARLLIAVLAAALMARMPLHGRIYEMGFYQAALAGVLVPAVLLGELPGRIGAGRWGRPLLVTAGAVLIGVGTLQLAARSQGMLGARVYPLGEGRDRFYAFDPRVSPISEVVGFLSGKIQEYPAEGTLLVLPEGEMINYLARRPCPVAPFFFFSAATSGGREEEIVGELKRHPPSLVVVVSRDLRGYGVTRYGERPGEGKQLLRWVAAHYKVAWHIGGDPLDDDQVGGLILTPRAGDLSAQPSPGSR